MPTRVEHACVFTNQVDTSVPNLVDTIIILLLTKVSGHNNSCWGTNVSGNKCVWAQTCLGTNVSGHKCVWATNVEESNIDFCRYYLHIRKY